MAGYSTNDIEIMLESKGRNSQDHCPRSEYPLINIIALWSIITPPPVMDAPYSEALKRGCGCRAYKEVFTGACE